MVFVLGFPSSDNKSQMISQQFECQDLIACFHYHFDQRRGLFDQFTGQSCTANCANGLPKHRDMDEYLEMTIEKAGLKVLLQPRFEMVG